MTLERKALVITCDVMNCKSEYSILTFDSRRLQQVLLNLLTNAIKFQKEGEIKVNAYVKKIPVSYGKSSLKLNVSVEDKGVGIAFEDAPHIFEPFYQGSKHKQLNPMGTGVGLSICKEICQCLGGDINVFLNPFGGCEFTFTMDVYKDNNENSQNSPLNRTYLQQKVKFVKQIDEA